MRLFWLALAVLLLIGSHASAQTLHKRPNILLAIADDQSYPHAGAYGTIGLNTPGFNHVAMQGTLFENCFAASPGCSPSRASLLTGRHTWQIEEAGTHASSFPLTYKVYPDILEQAGYFVGFTGKGWGPGNWKASGRTRNPCGEAYSGLKNESPEGISKVDYSGNFAKFLSEKPQDQPFCFWYGATEPHRSYKKGIGLEQGKNLADATVPPFLPDTPEIRSDILDYYVEIEWFDSHLVKILAALEEAGELENTLIIVTADNGMPFPRAKANGYEYGAHVPLAICWPGHIPAAQVIHTPVDFTDLAPTILEAAGMQKSVAMTGESLLPLMNDHTLPRRPAFSARERHSSSREHNWTYPIRSMRTDEYLLIWNPRADRWPAGHPAGVGKDPFGYYDIDGCPSKTFLWEHRDDPTIGPYFHLAIDKRPEWELYEVKHDSGNLQNLAGESKYKETFASLQKQMREYLRNTNDPRVVDADGGEIYESYPRFSAIREFPSE